MSVPLGKFQPGDIVTGKVVALEPTGALVDFDIKQLVHVPLSELSLSEIQSPDEALRVGEIREFLVVGNYDGQREIFFSNCSPETLISSDRLLETAQDLASLQCGYSWDQIHAGCLVNLEDIILHTQVVDVVSDGKHPGVSARLKWFLCSEDHPPTVSFSIRQLQVKVAWERVRQLQVENVTVHATVLKKHSRSATVRIEGLRASIQTYVDKHREELVEGKELPLKILKVKEEYELLRLLHQPVWLRLKQLQVGQIVNGRILDVGDSRVLVDIGDIYAVLTSSTPNSSAEQLSQTFKVGAPLEARITEVDTKRWGVVLESIDN